MCGIFGYVGKSNAAENVLEGLKRLEYRGYDSWGIAVIDSQNIKIHKQTGAIGDLETIHTLPFSNIGIGHTRWATHGGVTEHNAHPHFASDMSFVLAQNGIVENYQELKAALLEGGYEFKSQTDTEVIVHLIEEKRKVTDGDLLKAVQLAFLDLHGRNTIILLEASTGRIIAVRNGSPLVIGVGSEGEIFLASDTLSFADKTDNVIFMNDNDLIDCQGDQKQMYKVQNLSPVEFNVQKIDHGEVTIDKGGFDHFMIKEIVEQQHTIREAIQYTQADLLPLVELLKNSSRIYTVGAGTASFAAMEIAYFLRKYANLPAFELKSYEMSSYAGLFDDKSVVLAVSQSGETADTIEALEIAKSHGAKIVSIVNMIGSTISRMSDLAFLSRSGPEICVASTKAFTAQISWGLMVAASCVDKYDEARKQISALSTALTGYLAENTFQTIKDLADTLIEKEHFFVLGKGANYAIALEAALKVKEITYKHFEGFAAGELKHGVIALVDQGTPVFVINDNDELEADIYSAAAEVKARGATVIGIGKKNNELYDFFVPTIAADMANPMANVIPFQLLSYFLGVKLGRSPDKPRNLAKSVTVK